MKDLDVMCRDPKVTLKFVQLVLGAISIGVVMDGYPTTNVLTKAATIYGTQIGFIMITLILIMSYSMETPLHKNILVIVCFMGCIMWLTSGAFIIDFYLKVDKASDGKLLEDRVIVAGVFALINGVVFLVDLCLTIGINIAD